MMIPDKSNATMISDKTGTDVSNGNPPWAGVPFVMEVVLVAVVLIELVVFVVFLFFVVEEVVLVAVVLGVVLCSRPHHPEVQAAGR